MKTINIVPIPAPRPRFSKYGTYNTSKYTNYKNALKLMLKQQNKSSLIDYQIRLYVNFYLPIPKMSKKKTLEHENMPHYKKPDLDNLIKALKDAMNQVIYKDDNIVSSIIANKYYSSNPRIDYKIERMKGGLDNGM